MGVTERLLKELSPKVTPIASNGIGGDFILPNMSAVGKVTLAKDIIWSCDGTDVLLKNGTTTLLTINLTTGNMTLGGTQKRVICTKVVGA